MSTIDHTEGTALRVNGVAIDAAVIDEEAAHQAIGLQRLLERVAGDPNGLLQLDRAIDLFRLDLVQE